MIRWLKTRHFASLQAISWTRRGTRARSGSCRNRSQPCFAPRATARPACSSVEDSSNCSGIQQRAIYREVLIGDQSWRTHPLDNLALRRHRIQHLQTLYPQRLFRGNRWPPAFRIHGVKPQRHLAQNLFDHRAQRTILRHPVFRRQVTEHVTLPTIKSQYDLVLTAHCVELKQLFQHPASVVSVEG